MFWPTFQSFFTGFKQAPCTEYENHLVQNTLNIHKEQRLQSEEQITPEKLAGLLQVPLEDGSCCSTHRQLNAEKQHLCLVQRSVDQHFPKLPPDVDQNLHQYLENVQKMVITEFVRLGPPLTRMGLMGSLIDCYHRETFTRLDDLLQNVRSSKNSFGLMKWVLHTYLRYLSLLFKPLDIYLFCGNEMDPSLQIEETLDEKQSFRNVWLKSQNILSGTFVIFFLLITLSNLRTFSEYNFTSLALLNLVGVENFLEPE